MVTWSDLTEHFKVCGCHDSWDQCPCAEGGHYPNCDCCGNGVCGPLHRARSSAGREESW